jgi:DNA-directed RNA polymerase subunit RPC12/RpoP
MRINKPVKLKLVVECIACKKTWRIDTDVKEGSPEQRQVACPDCGNLALPVRGDKLVSQP